MKRIFLLSAALIACLTTAGFADPAQQQAYEDPEMYSDAFDARMQDIEWVLQHNPVLMESVVNTALRSNPSAVQEIIRDTILRNPEIIISSLQEFQRKQKEVVATDAVNEDDVLSVEFLSEARKSDDAPVRGNPKGSVTIVEFSDYNCEYCRHFDPTLKGLIARNDDLRVVHREWPILSQESVDVAKIALAAQQQGAYEKLHVALMQASGKVDKLRALEIAKDLGLDADKLAKDAEDPKYWAHIQRTADLAKQINLKGTPGIIIGDTLARGLVDAKQIQPIIDRLSID